VRGYVVVTSARFNLITSCQHSSMTTSPQEVAPRFEPGLPPPSLSGDQEDTRALRPKLWPGMTTQECDWQRV
jgi:hypothetical protein